MPPTVLVRPPTVFPTVEVTTLAAPVAPVFLSLLFMVAVWETVVGKWFFVMFDVSFLVSCSKSLFRVLVVALYAGVYWGDG